MRPQAIPFPVLNHIQVDTQPHIQARVQVLRLGWALAVCCILLGLIQSTVHAQLQTLSKGNTDAQWRAAQIEVLDKQLLDKQTPENLRLELKAQRDWLSQWSPGPSKTEPGKLPGGAAPVAASNSLKEPILDPNKLASDLRAALFHPTKRPTTDDTTALQNALMEHSGDVGLRQLQMHWLDQPRYRDEYWKEIGQACDRVIALLDKEEPSEQNKAAQAHAYYRKARALAHCLQAVKSSSAGSNTKVAGAANMKADEQELLRDTLTDCGHKIASLVGNDRPEFFQLEIYLLRRDGWSGRALQLLERCASTVDESAYLTERKSILTALNWTKPMAQTEAKLANIGEQRLLEIRF